MPEVNNVDNIFGPNNGKVPPLRRQYHKITPEQAAKMESRANVRNHKTLQNDNLIDLQSQPPQPIQSHDISTSTVEPGNGSYYGENTLLLHEVCDILHVEDPNEIISKFQELYVNQDEVKFLKQETFSLKTTLQNLEDQMRIRNQTIASLNSDINDLKQIRNELQQKNQKLEEEIKSSSKEAKQVTIDLLSSKKELENYEKESNAKVLLKDQQIASLEKDVFALKEKEIALLKDNESIKASKISIEKENKTFNMKLENLKIAHQDEKLSMERKIKSMKKTIAEKESKCESLSDQVSTSKSHCNKKIAGIEKQHSKILHQLMAEIKILRDIIDKHFGGSNDEIANFAPSSSPVENIKNQLSSELFQSNSDSNLLYIRQLYEDRYLNSLKENKDLINSNSILLTAFKNLIDDNVHFFKKLIPQHERFAFFVLVCKEIKNRKIFRSTDINILKKFADNNDFLFKEIINKIKDDEESK
ncbi:hypothetical protein KGF54_000181 [Candida jiufengensis]|uniref:uncharacterized protein n=1 Tax=Candida jiufengensis TaxID=497108 RepID=UPI0022258F60|nr:uncharacterized protein KGF54_000181 [Candida jiufengensis]KAI5957253.1 hypothetical protein KGF54_000181 [Candida jiufengensis]